MARSNPRLAAGIGITVLFFLLGGPGAAIAFSDPGGEHSDRGGNSSSDGNGSGRGTSRGGGSDDADNGGSRSTNTNTNTNSGGNRHAEADAGTDDDGVTPKVRFGSGRDDQQQWVSPGGNAAQSSSTSASVGSGDSGATGATGPGADPGSSGPGAVNGFQSPRVTFGNGRTPGADTDGPGRGWRTPASGSGSQPAPQPPPPPAPPPPPSWVHRIATHPAPTKQLGVAPAADLSDPLWGVAGLLLIPAAGAVLGYRQARAAQAVEKLRLP